MSCVETAGLSEGEIRDDVSWVRSFVVSLRANGYSEYSVKKRKWAVGEFVRWLAKSGVSLVEVEEKHVASFLERSGARPDDRRSLERTATRLFLQFVRGELGVAPDCTMEVPTASQIMERSYAAYLRCERGLAEQSVRIYLPYVRDFIAAHEVDSGCFSPPESSREVEAYLVARLHGRRTEYCRLVACVLRSFLRFMFAQGTTASDLSGAVPTVRRWSLAHVPQFLTREQIEHILARTELTTAKGRRDYAMLLLLARLGLRAGEVVALELDDIRWRTGELVVHGKGRRVDTLPLPADVGEALAHYVQDGRGKRDSRRVFLRTIAPFEALAGPAAVGDVVRTALVRAGISRTRRGAAHLFRHSLATRMIRNGASLSEIAEILRHGSLSSTELYAKVSFESLRSAARPWPSKGELS